MTQEGRQVDGVKFMFGHVAGKKPSGCILAHSMGLGKTLQVRAKTLSPRSLSLALSLHLSFSHALPFSSLSVSFRVR